MVWQGRVGDHSPYADSPSVVGEPMNELAMKIRQPKRRGEWVELRFMAAAAEHDLRVTKPWGDSAQYDFILEHDGRFVRIQVKSTQFKDNGAYPCAVHGSGQRSYPDDAFEFLAVYVVPEDVWYIIPAHAFRGQASVCLRLGSRTQNMASISTRGN